MSELIYQYRKKREAFIMWFWRMVPYSWLYWAINQAWALATCTKFTDKHPDEVTWSMMQKWLESLDKHETR